MRSLGLWWNPNIDRFSEYTLKEAAELEIKELKKEMATKLLKSGWAISGPRFEDPEKCEFIHPTEYTRHTLRQAISLQNYIERRLL